MKKVKVATVWLDGCSGCHMSLLDMDAAIIPFARRSTSSMARLWTPRSFPKKWMSRWWRARSVRRTTSTRSRKSGQRHSRPDFAGRLRRYRQRPRHAQFHSRQKLLQRIYVDGAEEGKVDSLRDRVPHAC